LNKKADVVRVYLPADANSLLCVTDHVLRTWNRINVIVAGKALSWQWLVERAVGMFVPKIDPESLAEMEGIASHGASRIPQYCGHLRNGRGPAEHRSQ